MAEATWQCDSQNRQCVRSVSQSAAFEGMKEVRQRGPGEYLRPGASREVIDKGTMSVAAGAKEYWRCQGCGSFIKDSGRCEADWISPDKLCVLLVAALESWLPKPFSAMGDS